MKRLIGFVLVLGIAFSAYAQSGEDKKAIKSIAKDVKTLSDDKMNGRETGTPGEAMAADYIAGRMEKLGLTPYGIGGYFQSFTFTPRPNPHAENVVTESMPITGKNVIGYIDKGAVHTVVIGAHYDHWAREPRDHSTPEKRRSTMARTIMPVAWLRFWNWLAC